MDVDILKKIAEKKQAFIDSSIVSAQGEIVSLETELLNAILSDYITQFDVKDGVLVQNSKNYQLLANLDDVFTQFQAIQYPLQRL
jgi:hypothetical protein